MKESVVGKTFGIYKIVEQCPYRDKYRHALYRAKCIHCGTEMVLKLNEIKSTTHCKHLRVDGTPVIDHKVSWDNPRLGGIFRGMMARCYGPNRKSFENYGLKGIKVCDQWREDPKKFEAWAVQNGYQENLTIDRIDCSGDYCPENCRWVTLSDNAKYKSTTHLIDVDGVVHTGREWASILNLGCTTINKFFRENDEEKVKEFIRRRLKDPTKYRKSHQTMFDVYDIT